MELSTLSLSGFSFSASSPESCRCFFTGGEGAAKLCVPEPIYVLKALRDAVAPPRRVGLLLRAKPSPDDGDLDRAAAAKGEDAEAKASNPDRLVPVGEVERFVEEWVLFDENAEGEAKTEVVVELDLFPVGIANGDEGFMAREEERLDAEPLLVPASGLGEGVDFCPKTEGPLADANGEAVEAYARNPPCNVFSILARHHLHHNRNLE